MDTLFSISTFVCISLSIAALDVATNIVFQAAPNCIEHRIKVDLILFSPFLQLFLKLLPYLGLDEKTFNLRLHNTDYIHGFCSLLNI